MVTDQQVRLLMSLINKGMPLSTAAAKSGMGEPTGEIGGQFTYFRMVHAHLIDVHGNR